LRHRSTQEISVLIAAYNAERHILQSVQSVLSQTYEDFEVIVVDDASTDRTRDILYGIADRRLRIIENPVNLGVVGASNRAMAAATGRYIARIDSDDYCLPTRFEKQRSFLDSHPRSVIVATEMSVLRHGKVRFSRQPAHPDPHVTRWMLHISNPIGNPSMMFRTEVVQQLGCYLREDFKYAEDFDFSHRVLRLGEISVIPEYLVIYRQHDLNLTFTRRATMIARTEAVLRSVYADLLGPGHDRGAELVARHLAAGETVHAPGDFEQLGTTLNDLIAGFEAAYGLDAAQRQAVIGYAGKLWWQMIQQSLRAGRFASAARHHGHFRWSRETKPSAVRIARSFVSGLMRWPSRLSRLRDDTPSALASELRLNDVSYRTIPVRRDDPICLYVVVDTEAEFDWDQKFDRSATGVSAMSRQILAQSIFDHYGVRPIYLIDYAVASQPEGYEPLRTIFNRHGCVIGAHLHPWINPPLEEHLSERNSFAGNLPPELEERKLQTLIAQIEASFGITPLFFKAGRYGIGPNTMEILSRAGFVVDFSIMPMADMRSRGGPDFRFAGSQPYEAVSTGILSLPMTRAQLGLIAPMPQPLHSAVHSARMQRLRLPGIMSRLGLANTVTLTPEGVTVSEQVQLIKTMVARGQRTFVMHYHSSTLGMHTPYVRDEAQLAAFLQNIAAVCGFFFLELGGYPGNPADLVPQGIREQIWPDLSNSG
jgi:glycosyltransferase involved in cell wall biosynthesis